MIFLPIVAITRYPNVARPTTIPTAPTSRIQGGTVDFETTSPVVTTPTIAATGPIALATSLEPWANAMPDAVTTMRTPNTFSTLA